jgi:hypothetical protein
VIREVSMKKLPRPALAYFQADAAFVFLGWVKVRCPNREKKRCQAPHSKGCGRERFTLSVLKKE